MSEAGTEGTGTGAAAAFLALAFLVPAWPSSRYGLTPVRLTFFAQVVAAIDTEPAGEAELRLDRRVAGRDQPVLPLRGACAG